MDRPRFRYIRVLCMLSLKNRIVGKEFVHCLIHAGPGPWGKGHVHFLSCPTGIVLDLIEASCLGHQFCMLAPQSSSSHCSTALFISIESKS